MNTTLLTTIFIAGISADGLTAPPSDRSSTQRLEQQFQKQAETYAFAADPARTRPFVLHKTPVMRWTADGNFGAVWVWTEKNRPQLVGCLGSFRNGNDELEGFHEFHAIAEQPLPRTRIGPDYVWEPTQAGPTPQCMNAAPVPAATHRLRLLQMRQLAREFHFELRSGKQISQLRLSPSPIYDFEATDSEVIDGALFSYLWDVGTDPEALLLLECRRTTDGLAWFFIPLRFSWRELTLRHDEQEIWHVPERVESRTSKLLRDHYISCPVGRIDTELPSDEVDDAKK